MPNTIKLHRVLRTTPTTLYRAFLDADAMVKWLPPNGYTGKVHRMDLRVGGGYAMSFTNFATGQAHSWTGVYRDLQEGQRIQYSATFDDPGMSGEMVTTVSLRAVSVGTELTVVQEGIPDLIPPEACYLGWQESLILLGRLVEAPLPG
ncbi:MAG TPA: SRPBCC family protein [Rhodopila sp.]|uniref:SRPBCC family protein n=1 Tax=Rhodopila sp. TaxID=2480087 RepID=UPI002B777ABF|nr:SRPBCC family protein [Rhodopila sp.]HVY18025.1 SRPBCC family protein [Rhodopila sp.]